MCMYLYMYIHVSNYTYIFILYTGNGEESIHKVVFFGDQLTAERARKGQDARVNSKTNKEALLGLQPAISDWHAESNFLQVYTCISCTCIFVIAYTYFTGRPYLLDYISQVPAFREGLCCS